MRVQSFIFAAREGGIPIFSSEAYALSRLVSLLLAWYMCTPLSLPYARAEFRFSLLRLMPSFLASRVLAARVVRVHSIIFEEKRETASCLIKGLARDSFTNTFMVVHAVVSRVKLQYSEQQKRAACFDTLLQNEGKSNAARFTTMVQPFLGTTQIVASCVNTDF